MPGRYAFVTLVLLGLLGCSRQSSAVKDDGHPKPGQAPAESAPAPEPPLAAPAGLSVVAEPDSVGSVQLRIQNRGQQTLSLRPQLGIAKQGETTDLDGQVLSVRIDCDETPTGCVALSPGAELLPAPLHLRQGDMQCGGAGHSLANATYDVVVHGCQEQPYRAVTVALPTAR